MHCQLSGTPVSLPSITDANPSHPVGQMKWHFLIKLSLIAKMNVMPKSSGYPVDCIFNSFGYRKLYTHAVDITCVLILPMQVLKYGMHQIKYGMVGLRKREGRRGREKKEGNNSFQARTQHSGNPPTWINKGGNEASGLLACVGPISKVLGGPQDVCYCSVFPLGLTCHTLVGQCWKGCGNFEVWSQERQ